MFFSRGRSNAAFTTASCKNGAHITLMIDLLEEADIMVKKNDSCNAPPPRLLGPWRLLVVISSLCFGTFLVALDTTIISVAVPSIATYFQAFDSVGWYGSAYLLTVTAFQPAIGTIFKLFDERRDIPV